MVSDKVALTVKGVYAGYNRVKVLHGVDLRLEKGEIGVLLGTNGNGKTTLLRCLSGLLQPDSGEITLSVDGPVNIVGKKAYELVAEGVSLIPEGRLLFASLTVEENLVMGAFSKLARTKVKENMSEVYATFPLLEERKRQLASTLSGGQQQMLAIGRGLMSNPKLLMIDEPSLGLAPILVAKVMAAIKELRDKLGVTVLMAEQNFFQASRIADRGFVMTHGKIVSEAVGDELRDAQFVKNHYLSKGALKTS